MKRAKSCIPVFIIYSIFVWGACREKPVERNVFELNGTKVSAPTNIHELKQKVERIYLNKQGFLEAEFRQGIILIYIPTGKFTMGTTQGEDKELPEHSVHLDGYWIGKYPVTVAQFRVFVKETGYITDSERGEGSWIAEGGQIKYDVSWDKPNFKQDDSHPVICVSWNDADAYIKWISSETGIDFCLPTEAQWERAARGTDQRTYPWGNEVPDGSQANFADVNYGNRFGEKGRNSDSKIDDGYAQTSPVDAYPKGQSPYGVFDMAGNTIDWLFDWYDPEYYSKSPLHNPIGPVRNIKRKKHSIPGGWASNLQRSIRGGAWTDASGELSLAEGGQSVRSDMRERTDQYSSDDHLGFRLAYDYVSREPKIVFQSQRDKNVEIYFMNTDGSKQTRLTHNPSEDIRPAWSFDRTEIVFASKREGVYNIYRMNRDGRDVVKVTDNPAEDTAPAWSSDGLRILFDTLRDGNTEIYSIEIGKKDLLRLTKDPFHDTYPSCSPDGTTIVFESTRNTKGKTGDIFAMNPDGSGLVCLTDSPSEDILPSWSPDSKKIIFSTERDGNLEIYLIDRNGSNPTRLTNNPAEDVFASYSPNGLKIVFQSNRDGHNEIYTMDTDGSNIKRLTYNKEGNSNPSWSFF